MKKSILLVSVIIMMAFLSKQLYANYLYYTDKANIKTNGVNYTYLPCLSVLNYDVTFHVTGLGLDLQGAWITVGPVTLQTNNAGIAVFNLPDGDYTYTVTKEGFVDAEGSFAVAGTLMQIEVEMEECWDIVLHLIDMNGLTITDSAWVIVNNDTVWSTTGSPSFCVTDLTINYEVYIEGYYPNIDVMTIPPYPVILEIIMNPIFSEITFFVNCCGEPLGGIALTIGVQTIVTFPTGMAILSLPAGTYSYIAGGIEGTVTIPPPAYIDLDICGEVTFHVTNEPGNPLENVLIDVDGSYLLTDFNGEADTCLQVGSYTYAASKLGYVAQTGTLEVDTIPQTVEIVMPAETWAVSFNCPANCTNDFNGWKCEINGVILSSGETIYLSNGSWDTYISWLGCWGVVGQIIVNSSPVNITCFNLDNPVATFHVQGQTGNLQGATVTVDTFSLITNSSGDVSFCLPGGYHSYIITHEEYDTLTGNFTWSNHCQDTLLNFLMNPVSIKEERNSIFRIYPNPSAGNFYLETPYPLAEPIEVMVTDLTGRKVYSEIIILTGKAEINLADQPKGMYFLRVKSREGLLTKKIVIQ